MIRFALSSSSLRLLLSVSLSPRSPRGRLFRRRKRRFLSLPALFRSAPNVCLGEGGVFQMELPERARAAQRDEGAHSHLHQHESHSESDVCECECVFRRGEGRRARDDNVLSSSSVQYSLNTVHSGQFLDPGAGGTLARVVRFTLTRMAKISVWVSLHNPFRSDPSYSEIAINLFLWVLSCALLALCGAATFGFEKCVAGWFVCEADERERIECEA